MVAASQPNRSANRRARSGLRPATATSEVCGQSVIAGSTRRPPKDEVPSAPKRTGRAPPESGAGPAGADSCCGGVVR
ncbi:hypothetical protein Stsp01_55070 [Streptomyces sp. NBRC 13847]|nr:hypothetical protein Stsp01_55070 [Streptomyces sp. NBRC 13847]